MHPQQSHLTEDQVEDYVCRRLSGQALDAAEEHLLYCHPCLDWVEETESIRNLVCLAADEAPSFVEAFQLIRMR